jgi:anaerobic magnesium-protoporphyrin IX monomethyl ester cyclase
MRALLVQLPHEDRVPSVFPVGIANVAAAMTQEGVEVEVLDVFALGYSASDVSEYLKKSRWDVIGINAFSTQYPWATIFAAEAKRHQKQALIVMGGPLPTFNAELVLQKTATEICVIGEGEETIKDLVRNLGNPGEVAGICFKSKDGRIVRTSPRPYIKDLDSLPFTNYDIFPMGVYFKWVTVPGVAGGVKTVNMLTSRGCPYACNFCSKTFRGARFRSIDKIIEEIAELRDRYGIQGVIFSDELLLVKKKRTYELCEKIRPLKIYWSCQGRANTVDLDLLKTMKSVGCTSVGYGIESGSQKILDNMNKKVTVAQNERAITNTLKAGMIPVVQMIYGYPGEDADTIRETQEFFERIHFYPATAMGECEFSLLTPLPGSPLYQELLANGRIADEESYLEKLEHGYNIDCPLRMNLTRFSDEELLARKSLLSNQVKAAYEDYVRRHPAERLRAYLRMFSSIRFVEGYPGVIRRAARSIYRHLY